MVSREDRVIAGSVVLLLAVATGLVVLNAATGVMPTEQPLVAYLLVTGLAIVGPQLYLAATDDDVSPRTRVRFAAIALGAFALLFADVSAVERGLATGSIVEREALQHLAIAAIGGGGFVALVCYEFVAGYRSHADGGSTIVSR
ncbi:hypothetical protein EA472_16200 [Natrarchaeobius oligotrophus]|uniref:Uncharacterized protein n=2 Tax=Natrarchaeobius TaxID=2501796 RepID=A0A3N6PFL0_NATCH|nr:hypothetical protein EA472_16200 [Natrarchaeobius chitinivorans]